MNTSTTIKMLMVLVSGVGIGCSPRPSIKAIEWRGEGPLPSFKSESLRLAEGTKLKKQQVKIETQEFAGVPVEGAFVKTVSDSAEKPVLLRAMVLRDFSSTISRELADVKARLPEIKELLMRSLGQRFKTVIAPVDIELNQEGEIRLFAIAEDSLGRYVKLTWNTSLEYTGESFVGSGFHDGVGWAFPESPLRSQIMDVPIKHLLGDGTLSGRNVTVTSDSPHKAKAPDLTFKYPVEDEKFDQVQVYYHINKALDWFENAMSWSLQSPLKVVLAVGYPLKTNTAFYYQGQVRIGSGDDEVFAKIPHDPSIVVHETTHAMVEAVARLPYQGEGGSINEAFADFFTAVYLNSPRMGEYSYKKAPYKRTLENSKSIAEKSGGLYADSLILSGTLWEIKEKVGNQKALRFAQDLLLRMTPASDFADVSVQMNELLKGTSLEEAKAIEIILRSRGWIK